MRTEVLEELKIRIKQLEKNAKPDEVSTGMTGSFICFNRAIDSYTAMTEQEFDDCVYDDWLKLQHKIIFKKING